MSAKHTKISKKITSEMELSFIIVNHRSDLYLKKCLASIAEASFSFSYEVIVVHNDGEIHEGFLMPKEIPLRIYQTEDACGYGTANNFGAKFTQGKNLCFLNPDTLILEGDFGQILDLLEKEIGIVGPKLVTDEQKNVQPWCTGEEITLAQTIKNNLGLGASKMIWQKNEPILTDWVSGACLFIRKNLFEELGGFDEKFFMYFEDVDLCRRAKAKKQKILYFPIATVFHWGGKSQQSDAAQKKFYYASQDYYFQKHFGTFSRQTLQFLRFIFRKKA